MLLGFISLLLAVLQRPITKICIPIHLTNSMLPCTKETHGSSEDTAHNHSSFVTLSQRRFLSEASEESHCPKGNAPLLSLEAVHQLHIFIFVLAVVYLVSCGTIMVLSGMKVHRWKHWEDTIRLDILNSSDDPNRVGQIHDHHHYKFKQRGRYSMSWLISFFKQFYGSVTKSDYFSLRLIFIMTHCSSNPKFNFHGYMMKSLEDDFKKVVGISWYLWAFVVLFLLVNLKGWHAFFWLSFLPLILLLLVGAKLEHVITCLAEDIEQKSIIDEAREDTDNTTDVAPSVKPSDKYFWFGSPNIVLYLIHFILFQNAFEIAFFFWVLSTYGIHSCIVDKTAFIIPRLLVGVIVQVLCSYSTLPLYTIVTQMGSSYKRGIFNQHVQNLLHLWADDRRGRCDESRVEVGTMDAETLQIPTTEELQLASMTHSSS